MKTNHPFLGAVLFCLLSATASFGQYFSQDIQANNDELANWGEVSRFGDKGNLLTGFTTYPAPFQKHAVVFRSDPNGVVAYENTYSIWAGPNRHDVYACYGSENPLGDVAMAGIDIDPATGAPTVFFSLIDMIGNPMNALRYNAPGYSGYEVKGIYNDVINNQLLICGSAVENASGRRISYVLSVNPGTGVINWNQFYDMGAPAVASRAYDAVFNPFTKEYVLVGELNGGLREGWVMTVNVGNGLPFGSIPVPAVFGTGLSDDVFNSVDYLGRNGDTCLVISGFSDVRGNYDAWAVKCDFMASPASVVSNLYDNSNINYNNRAYHIIKRIDMAGYNTLFLGGDAMLPGGMGTYRNVDIYKLDNNLNWIANFMEGNPATNDMAAQLGNSDGSTGFPMGLVSFGNKRYAGPVNNNLHINKFYFSGHIPCVTQLVMPGQYPGPLSLPDVVATNSPFNPLPGNIVLENMMIDGYICNGVVAAGSNAKTGPMVALESISGTKGQWTITVQNHSEDAREAELLISDVLGRIWAQEKITLSPGTTEYPLAAQLQGNAAGVYLVTLRSEAGTATKRIFLD